MNKPEDNAFYKKGIDKYLTKDGDMAPPWAFNKNSHPYSIYWRMGIGEFYVMIFSEWFSKNIKSYKERIEFFKKYPAPPRWLGWMADAIWDLETIDENFDYSQYFNKLKKEGFKGIEKYQQDLNDEKWL